MIVNNLQQDLKDMLSDLIPQLNSLTIQYMTQGGVSKQSNLTKSVGFEVTDTGISLVANNYFYYSSKGRKPGTRKVPITALIDYIKRYGISPRPGQTINQLAFAIQTAIYKQGINPKNYADKVVDGTSDLTEQVIADEMIIKIGDEVVDLMLQAPGAKLK